MNIYYRLEDFKPLDFAVVTSGTFDGVHMGHQAILRRIHEIAGKYGGESVIVTYWPHPRLVLYPEDTSLKLLNTFEEKAELLRQHGVDHLLRVPFTKEFARSTSEAFIQNVLVEIIGTKKLVIGYDHRFGNNREGRFEELKENSSRYGFEVEEIPKKEIDHVGVSSTKIRVALLQGDVHLAKDLLGHYYSITGRVVKGAQIGAMLGFPTANLEIDSKHKLIPADGAYAILVQYRGQAFKGMLNIGFRPTIEGTDKTIEVHIFDFDATIYGENLSVLFVRQMRKEIKFEDMGSLKRQLATDEQDARQWLQHIAL